MGTVRHPVAAAFALLAGIALAALPAVNAIAGPTDPFTAALPARDTQGPQAREPGGGSSSVNEQTGAAAYTYPLVLPPGRAGMAPSLAFSYSSQNPLRGGLAAGWSFGVPTIEKDPDFLDGSRYSAGGQRLVPVTGDPCTYQCFRAEHDPSFTRYEYDAAKNEWKVRSLDGVTRTFAKHIWSTRWYLTEEIDAFGNRIDYAYDELDVGPSGERQYEEWVLRSIEYTGNAPAGRNPHAKVDMVYAPVETCGGIPVGAAVDHHFALRITGGRRLDRVDVSVRDTQAGAWRLARRYALGYDHAELDCDASGLRYLETIDVTAYDAAGAATAAPTVRFGYGPKHRTIPRALSLPDFGGGEGGTSRGPMSTLLDFDGDGWLDRLTIAPPSHRCQLDVHRGLGVGQFEETATRIDLPSAAWWEGALPTAGEHCTLSGQVVWRGITGPGEDGHGPECTAESAVVSYSFLDWDGDGLVDIVSNLFETDPGSAGGDFVPPFIEQDNCSGSCGVHLIAVGCDGGQVVCGCPDGYVFVEGESYDYCIANPCGAGEEWDSWQQQCESDHCFNWSDNYCMGGGGGGGGDGGGGGADPDLCVPGAPVPEPEPTGLEHPFRIHVQRNLGGLAVTPFADAMRVASPVSLRPNPTVATMQHAARPGVPPLIDITGDGFLDAISLTDPPDHDYGQPDMPGTEPYLYVWPGSGQDWFHDQEVWTLPQYGQQLQVPHGDTLEGWVASPGTATMQDLNADGLVDLVVEVGGAGVAAIHNFGGAFLGPVPLALGGPVDESRTEFGQIGYFPRFLDNGGRAHTTQLLDIDQDGLPEQLIMPVQWGSIFAPAVTRTVMRLFGGTLATAYDLGVEWEPLERLIYAQQGRWIRQSDAIDVTGDGLIDMVWWDDAGAATVYTDPVGFVPRLLQTVDNGRGAVTRFDYAASTDRAVVSLGDSHLSPRWLTRRVSTEVAGAPTLRTTYFYATPLHGTAGHDDRPPRFLGFETVTVDRSGQLGDDSARTVNVYRLAPLPQLVRTRSLIKTAAGAHTELSVTEQTYQNLGVLGATYATVPHTTTVSTFGGPSVAVATTTETWEPYAASGPTLHHQHRRTRVESAGLTPRVSEQEYAVRSTAAEYRQVVTQTTAGDGATVMAREITVHDSRLLPVETWTYQTASIIARTRRGFDVAGNRIWQMAPTQVEGWGLMSQTFYDEHLLFPQRLINELGHTIVQTHDVGTGVMTATEGPDPVDRQRWKIDGFGRINEHWVNADPGPALRQISKIDFEDTIPNRIVHASVQDFATGAQIRSTSTFDGLGRLTEAIDRRQVAGEPDAITRYTYDAGGALARMEVPDPRVDTGATVTYQWIRDGQGRPTSFVRPDGGGQDVVYTGLETRALERGPHATLTILRSDALGDLREVLEYPNPTPTRYTYDALGRMDTITDADGVVTDFDHDMRGGRVAIRRNGQLWQYRYDRDGNQTHVVSPVPAGAAESAYTSVTDYDVLGRVEWTEPARRGMSSTERDRLGIGLVEFEYDRELIGRPSAVWTPFGTTELAYDTRGRVRRETRWVRVPGTSVDVTQWVDREYDVTGAPTRVRWDDGTEWSFKHDPRGQVVDVHWRTSSSTINLAHYVRGVAGKPRSRTGYKQRRDWTYDQLGRPTYDRIWLTNTNRTLAERSYGYLGDEIAEVWGYNDGLVADASYRYDARHRLEHADGPLGYVADVSYSGSGNVKRAAISGALDTPDRDATYRYGAFDPQAVDTFVDPLGNQTAWMDYDLAGNLTRRTLNDGTELTLTWDGDNQLRETRGPNGTETFLFGPGAERMVAIGPDTVKLWFGESETHYARNGNLKVRYHHIAVGEPIARIEGGRKAELQYADALANLMLATDSKGAVLASVLYGAFGELVAQSGERTHRRQFNGKEHDAISGLRHYGYRSYDPVLLRWVSGDPKYRFAPDSAWTEPQRANLYAFSLNNPLRYFDPDGREGFDEAGGHHYVPQSVTRGLQEVLGLSDEAAAVFNKTTTGWPKPHVMWNFPQHGWSVAHKLYNARVIEAFIEYAVDEGIDIQNMTSDQAHDFIKRVRSSKDPILHGFIEPHERLVKSYKAGKKLSSRQLRQIADVYEAEAKSFRSGGAKAGKFKTTITVGGKVLSVTGTALDVFDIYRDIREEQNGKIQLWWSEEYDAWIDRPPFPIESVKNSFVPTRWEYPELYTPPCPPFCPA